LLKVNVCKRENQNEKARSFRLCYVLPSIFVNNVQLSSEGNGNLPPSFPTCKGKFLVGHVARMGEKRNAYRLLVGKPDGKRPLGRLRRRRVDNIRMDLGEVG
jgi:hypothetical protein